MKPCKKHPEGEKYADGRCKYCRRERNAKYVASHPDKKRENGAKYRAPNLPLLTVLYREFDDIQPGELTVNSTTSKKVPVPETGNVSNAKVFDRKDEGRRLYEDELEPLSPYNLEKRTKQSQIYDLHRIQYERKLSPPGRRIG